ncbi:MAG: KOW motif-containing protein [Gammaproteobacteria bacterium]|nr:KOW motif-containing protein [Gammaproteobacteria bacterium]
MSRECDLHARWLGGARLVGVRFIINDYVEVLSGKHVGESGSVVSVIKFEPNTSYIVETESGQDIEVKENEIEIANS